MFLHGLTTSLVVTTSASIVPAASAGSGPASVTTIIPSTTASPVAAAGDSCYLRYWLVLLRECRKGLVQGPRSCRRRSCNRRHRNLF